MHRQNMHLHSLLACHPTIFLQIIVDIHRLRCMFALSDSNGDDAMRRNYDYLLRLLLNAGLSLAEAHSIAREMAS